MDSQPMPRPDEPLRAEIVGESSRAPLRVLGRRKARCELRVVACRARPPLDAARSLEPRDRSDELRARHPELRRERMTFVVERRLLGDRGPTERAASRDAAKCPRLAPELTFDDLLVGQRFR